MTTSTSLETVDPAIRFNFFREAIPVRRRRSERLRGPLLAGAILAAAPALAELPWKLDRTYKYAWFHEGDRVGEILFTFRKVPQTEDEPLYQLSSIRHREHNGSGFRATADLFFREDGTPVRYEDASQVATPAGAKGRQELRLRFGKEKASWRYVNNGKDSEAVDQEVEVPKEARLFTTWALEQWTLLALQLGGETKEESALKVLYPAFAKVLEITFRKGEAETIEAEGGTLPATRYHFRCKRYEEFSGSIWIDANRRLIQYESGPLRLVLSGKD